MREFHIYRLTGGQPSWVDSQYAQTPEGALTRTHAQHGSLVREGELFFVLPYNSSSGLAILRWHGEKIVQEPAHAEREVLA